MAKKRNSVVERRHRQRIHKAREQRRALDKAVSRRRRKATSTPTMFIAAHPPMTDTPSTFSGIGTKGGRRIKTTRAPIAAIPVTRKGPEARSTPIAATQPSNSTPAVKRDPSTPISDLGLPQELFDKLDATGVTSLGQFAHWSRGALSALGIKQNMLDLLEQRVKEAGYKFKPDRQRNRAQ